MPAPQSYGFYYNPITNAISPNRTSYTLSPFWNIPFLLSWNLFIYASISDTVNTIQSIDVCNDFLWVNNFARYCRIQRCYQRWPLPSKSLPSNWENTYKQSQHAYQNQNIAWVLWERRVITLYYCLSMYHDYKMKIYFIAIHMLGNNLGRKQISHFLMYNSAENHTQLNWALEDAKHTHTRTYLKTYQLP